MDARGRLLSAREAYSLCFHIQALNLPSQKKLITVVQCRLNLELLKDALGWNLIVGVKRVPRRTVGSD